MTMFSFLKSWARRAHDRWAGNPAGSAGGGPRVRVDCFQEKVIANKIFDYLFVWEKRNGKHGTKIAEK